MKKEKRKKINEEEKGKRWGKRMTFRIRTREKEATERQRNA